MPLSILVPSVFLAVILLNSVVWLTFRYRARKLATALALNQGETIRVWIKPKTQLKVGVVLVCLGFLQLLMTSLSSDTRFGLFPGSDLFFAVFSILFGGLVAFLAVRSKRQAR